jgi:NAD-dependent dihydropyrimidine dehydrogenase PreA subunit
MFRRKEKHMIRKIIRIDEEKCNGCGACASACHEGAIEMIDGKARLTKENYCDGLGDCLPACPMNAISFEMREAPAYDEAAVLNAKRQANRVCPGTQARLLKTDAVRTVSRQSAKPSRLMQWPCQIKLVPPRAPYFSGAHLLIAADCTAYAYASFHEDFMRGHVTLIGCPKLDEGNYASKLAQIISLNDIQSVKIVRMEVPCCGGLEYAFRNALAASGKNIPFQVITVTTDGKILK